MSVYVLCCFVDPRLTQTNCGLVLLISCIFFIFNKLCCNQLRAGQGSKLNISNYFLLTLLSSPCLTNCYEFNTNSSNEKVCAIFWQYCLFYLEFFSLYVRLLYSYSNQHYCHIFLSLRNLSLLSVCTGHSCYNQHCRMLLYIEKH